MLKRLHFVFPSEGEGDLSQRFVVLMLMAIAMQVSFATWWVLVNNFAIELVHASGREFGLMQSIREIPGFLAVLVVYMLLFIREQKLALVSLLFLGVGVAATGHFTSFLGFYLTTFVMSLGFHYYETVNQSISLQWLPKERAPALLGTILGFASLAQLAAYALVFIGARELGLSYELTFLVAGGTALVIVGLIAWRYPIFPELVTQKRKIVLKKRYWLYYLLTFLAGARRQIFVVFAGFLMVEKFGFHLHEVAALYFVNGVLTFIFAPAVGKMILRFGERTALLIEYCGLIAVFIGYGLVSSASIAIFLYLVDHAFHAMAIAMRTYFQKIADPEDMAPTASVAFTINHIAAVFIPAGFGAIWIYDHSLVFFLGAGIAAMSLAASALVPRDPQKGHETVFAQQGTSRAG